MKKFGFRIFALFLTLFMGVAHVSAAEHTMTITEHMQFIGDMCQTINKLAEKLHDRLSTGGYLAIEKYLRELSDQNDKFDEIYMKPDFTAKQYMMACWLRVMRPEDFVKQGLCCRGLSSFVSKHLSDRDISYKYVQFMDWPCTQYPDPFSESITPEDHAEMLTPHVVVKYSVGSTEYICDLMKAFEGYLAERYGSPYYNSCVQNKHGGHKWQDFLAFPIDEYKRLFEYKTLAPRQDPNDLETYLQNPWCERTISSDTTACKTPEEATSKIPGNLPNGYQALIKHPEYKLTDETIAMIESKCGIHIVKPVKP